MSYKYILTAVSRVGDTHQQSDEFYFADGLSSANKNVCNNASIQTICKGRKHIFSIISCSNNTNELCKFLNKALAKRSTHKIRVKMQYALRGIIDEMYAMVGKENDANMSMVYIDDSYIYASGFGNTSVYHLPKKDAIAKKISFPSPSLTNAITTQSEEEASCTPSDFCHSKCLGQLKANDEYLVVGDWLQSKAGDRAICDALSSFHSNSPKELIDNVYTDDSSKTVTALHIRVKKSLTSLWLSLGVSLVAIAAALITLF